MSEFKRTLQNCGDHILMKEVIEPIKLSARDILLNIDRNATELNKCKENINNMKLQSDYLNNQIKLLEESNKTFAKHEEWAETIQKSKLKALVDEVKDEVQLKVVDEYEQDDTLTKEQNDIQMFAQYKEYICRHPKIAKEIAGRIINNVLRKKGYISNPFS